MQGLLTVSCLLVLGRITWEDFKDRTVHVFLFPLLVVLLILNAYSYNQTEQLLWNAGVNFLFLFLQAVLLVAYFILKHRKWVNITKQYIGWGDVLFLLCLVPLFSPAAFVLFYISSLLATILFVLIYRLVVHKMEFIPLAGIQAVLLAFALGYQQLVDPRVFALSIESLIRN